MTRNCGLCSECCTSLEISGEGWGRAPKPAGKPCIDLIPLGKVRKSAGGGCAVYNSRPVVCKTFKCSWLLQPQLPDDLRPDKCGVMLSPLEPAPEVGGFSLAVSELREGALRALSGRQRDTLTAFSHHPNEWGLRGLGGDEVGRYMTERGHAEIVDLHRAVSVRPWRARRSAILPLKLFSVDLVLAHWREICAQAGVRA